MTPPVASSSTNPPVASSSTTPPVTLENYPDSDDDLFNIANDDDGVEILEIVIEEDGILEVPAKKIQENQSYSISWKYWPS